MYINRLINKLMSCIIFYFLQCFNLSIIVYTIFLDVQLFRTIYFIRYKYSSFIVGIVYMLIFVFRWRDSSINIDRLKASKTAWPIPQIKQVFLPDFKIKPQINENSFEVIKYFINIY